MKIAISSMGSTEGDALDSRFGRCNYFLIYEGSGDFIKAVVNKGQFSGGGAGIAAAQQIVNENIEVVITGSMGPNAFNIMKSLGIKVYQSKEGTIQNALEQFKKGLLCEISEAGPSHMGMSYAGDNYSFNRGDYQNACQWLKTIKSKIALSSWLRWLCLILGY